MSDAIERLRKRIEGHLIPWLSVRGWRQSGEDVKALLDAYDALEANYAKFRRGVRGALGKPSNLAVSDQWIIDGVRELETVATGLAEALERIERLPGSYLSLGEARAALAAWKEYQRD